jgi:hypothetical protein
MRAEGCSTTHLAVIGAPLSREEGPPIAEIAGAARAPSLLFCGDFLDTRTSALVLFRTSTGVAIGERCAHGVDRNSRYEARE